MKIPKITNLLLNMSSGLLPENLSKYEISLLKRKYGKNWFKKLGYKKGNRNESRKR